MSGPVRYGPGPGNDPYDGPAGRRDVPFGPEISWPYGFRQLDTESREVLESAYGTGPSYQQPAVDDYGYGDPGYSDPSYDGPKTPYAGPAYGGSGGYQSPGRAPGNPDPLGGGPGYRNTGPQVPGYYVPEVRPEVRESARPEYTSRGYQPQAYSAPPAGQDIWPVTGAQEALPDTGPQRTIKPAGRPEPGQAAYPEQWYDTPRLDDPVLDGPRSDQPGSADPRLEGINYGELRYDDPEPREPGHGERLDDESWYEELRRSAPAYPQGHAGPSRSGGSQGPAGPGAPQRRVEPQAPGFGQPSGYSQPPAPDRPQGYGQSRGWPSGPQMSAGRQPSSSFPQDRAAPGAGFLSAPAGQVGLLTPPTGTRVGALADGDVFPSATATAQFPAVTAGRPGTAVRPGHGLDGPEITSSWPAQPQVDEPDSYEDFWREDDDAEYTGLFGDREAERDRSAARLAAKRRTGRRRSGSNDRRLWLSLGGVVVVAAAAITGLVKFEFPSHGGPVHTMGTPDKIGTYARTVDLEHQADLPALRAKVISMSSGQASHVVDAVYESGNSAAGNTEQIVMFIGGHLANADPSASITSFMQQFKGATLVSAGALGGKAACVEEGSGSNSVGMCAWFDSDSFGEIVSPTMKAQALASEMVAVRPAVEREVKK